MRFAEGPTVEVAIDIDAPIERVWPLVTDVSVPARFSSEFQGAEWIERSDEATLGAKFLGSNAHEAIGEWQTTSTIVECDECRSFAWAVSDPDEPAATWRFSLAPNGDGTRLAYSVRLGPGPSGLTNAIDQRPDKEERIIAHRLEEHRRNMAATIEGIKRLAEER
jgi:hypothetical protein